MKKKIQNKIMRWLGVRRYFLYFYDENKKVKNSVQQYLNCFAKEDKTLRRKIDQLIAENKNIRYRLKTIEETKKEEFGLEEWTAIRDSFKKALKVLKINKKK